MERMHVFGTGQAVCLRYRNTCFALEQDGHYFLIDGGGGHETITAMTEMAIKWQNLHHAFLSHEHTDHLLGMVWVVRYIAELVNWNRYNNDFVVYGHDVAIKKLHQVCLLLLKPAQTALIGKRIHFVQVEDGQRLSVLGSNFAFFDIHSTKAKQFGFRMERPDGLILVFLGDEPFSEKNSIYMTGCDWLLTEAFCLYEERHLYNPYELHHSTVREAAECAARFKVKNLVLWHTEDESTYGFRKTAYANEALQFYSGNVHVPEDLEVVEFNTSL